MGGGDPTYDSAAASHRALREVRRELERHPAVSHAGGFPAESHTRVDAQVDPTRLGGEVEVASLTVRWFAGGSPGDCPAFSFHYTDAAGVERGWHHEPNPHVDGRGHYQERFGSEAEYRYEPYAFSTRVPSRVVWEVLDRLGESVPNV